MYICLELMKNVMEENAYSVQFSRSVMSNSLRPHELQHARPPCPSPTPEVHSDSRPSSQWCHLAISSSVVHFSSYPNPSQHQRLFQWVSSLHDVAKVLEFQLQHHSFQRNSRADLLTGFNLVIKFRKLDKGKWRKKNFIATTVVK